jgi:hypothetical protein
VGAPKGERVVSLARLGDGTLGGVLTVAVRNGAKRGRISVQYLPVGNTTPASAGKVTVDARSTSLSAGGLADIALNVSLPRDASPTDLGGVVILRLRSGRRVVGKSVELQIKGSGNPFAGVTIVPATVNLKVTQWAGPLASVAGFLAVHRSDTPVQLRGPGVPSLFAPKRQRPQPVVRLHASDGTAATATLASLKRTADPTVAEATLIVNGDLKPGAYTGVLPLSNLTVEGPKVGVKAESAHAFIWALLATFAGALLGGALYLASNLRRRKRIQLIYVRELLNRYLKRLAKLRRSSAGQPVPIWTLDKYLGPETEWYKKKWTALPELDGVQGVWSSIHWARNEEDLDATAQSALELRARIVRWLDSADAVCLLEEATRLRPDNPATAVWQDICAVDDSVRLLRRIVELPPPDDATAQSLIDRLTRQARWHAALARTWHMRTIVLGDMSARPADYDDQARTVVGAIDLAAVATESCPEETRTGEAQLTYEQKLDKFQDKLKDVYRGDLDDEVISGPDHAVALGAMTAKEARPGADLAIWSSERESVASDTTVAPGTDGEPQPGDGQNDHASLTGIGWRDVTWTLLISLGACAAYIAAFYGATWGTLSDYGAAFLAGFVGKAAINWGLLPAFQSYRVRAAKTTEPPPAPVAAIRAVPPV